MNQPVTPMHRRKDYPLAWIRAQYPALHAEAETDHVFLDNASGSQLPQAVIDAVVHTLSTMNVNKGVRTALRSASPLPRSRCGRLSRHS